MFANFFLEILSNRLYYIDKMKNNKELLLFSFFLVFLSGCLVKRDILHDPHFYYDKENYTLIRVKPETREEDIQKYLKKKNKKLLHTRPSLPPADSSKIVKEYDIPPKPKRIVKPIYPTESRLKGYYGTVLLKLLIDSTGVVLLVKPAKTVNLRCLDRAGILLVESALKAAIQFEFYPAYENGKPIKVWVSFPVQFILHKN